MGKLLEKLVDYSPVGLAVNAFGGDAGGTASKLLDSVFKGKSNTIQGQSDLQKLSAQKLASYLESYMGKYEPGKAYSGLSTLTNPTTQETAGLGLLSKYLSEGDDANLTAAAKVNADTLSGAYDPYSSEYYSRMKANLEKERLQNVAKTKQTAAKYGYRTSSGENTRLAQVGENTANKVSDLIASLQQQERANQLASVPYAAQIAAAKQSQAVGKIGASQQYGGLTRSLQGTGYNDFLRQQSELAGVVNTAMGGVNSSYTPDVTYRDPSIFSQVMSSASQLAPYLMMMM